MNKEPSVYDNYLNRRKTSGKNVVSTNAEEYTTEGLSSRLNEIEVELLQNCFSLSFISNNIEDTIIVLDDDGNEKLYSLERRKRTLAKFEEELDKNRNLMSRIKAACPDLDMNIKNELYTDEYQMYTAGISRLIKLCGIVNRIGVHEDDEDYLDYDSEDGESNTRNISGDSIKTYDDMLCFISENLDSISFERATLIERRFIKYKIDEFKRMIEKNGMNHEADFIDDINKVSRDNSTSLGHLEKYSVQIEGNKSQSSISHTNINEANDNDKYTSRD